MRLLCVGFAQVSRIECVLFNPPGNNYEKFLVVDDSPFMLKGIGGILTNLSHEVTTVDSGRLACQKDEAARL